MSKTDQVTDNGYFGDFGGRYVPEQLEKVLNRLDDYFQRFKNDPEFLEEYAFYLKEYVGRPNPLTYAGRLTDKLGGAAIYLKREDLNHTGAHKINNVLGQILLARKMGAHRVIAETGAGQHGVATATACAMMNMDCVIYMGREDLRRQELNVFRMELLGAQVVAVDKGGGRLKDAVDEALQDFVEHFETTFYLLGSAVGPHPYPAMVHHFQAVISEESRQQILEKEGRLPDVVTACVGGGSNAIGAFSHYIDEETTRLIGVEPVEAATMTEGQAAVLHGFRSLCLQDNEGNPLPTESIAAGLDYPGVGPEHSMLQTSGRASYETVTKQEVLAAFQELARTEGIIPALESAHAIAWVMRTAPSMNKEEVIVVNLSGRGDKDVAEAKRLLEE